MKKHLEGPVLKLDQSFDCGRFISRPPTGLQPVQLQNEDLQPRIQKGVIIVGAKNFLSSDGELSNALKTAGVACIIAASFSRPFYRNCINLGLPLIENMEAFNKITDGEVITIDFDNNQVACKKGIVRFSPHPEIISRILDSGGLIPHVKRSLGK